MRRRLLLALVVVTPLGFASKLYGGPGAGLVRDYVGGVLYEVFWILVVLLVRPALSPRRVALGVFCVTSALETLQLWRPPWLRAIRDTFLGAALLGTTFVWWDFLAYGLGCLLGLLLVRGLSERRGE